MNIQKLEPINLANLSKKTEQEVFDWVVFNLLQQGKKSQRYDACAYRGEDNTRCAAGWVISDFEYNKKYEGLVWDDLIYYYLEVPTDHVDLITSLQDIHDNHDVKEWRYRFIELAKNLELKYDHII